MRLAMWSGPRNLSTAMMYAFGNRADMTAVDEPFYAAFLSQTGIDHPMRQAILASQASDADAVVERLLATPPTPHFYAKMMTHHMVDGVPFDWLENWVNIHLIRHPARVIASYSAKRDATDLTLDDIGFAQAERLYRTLPGPVIDSADIRDDPKAMLRALCEAISLPFDPAMLHWPAGPKHFDGVWATHWYDAVHRSTRFAGAEGPLPEVADDHRDLLDKAMPIYEAMHTARLRP